MIKSFTEFTVQLARQQLKNTAAVDDQDTGELNPAHEDQILDLTNQGLIDITTKKKLWTDTQALTFVTDQNIYDLSGVEYDGFVKLLEVIAVPTDYEVIEENQRKFTPKGSNGITQPSPTSIRFSDRFMENYGPAVDLHFQKTHPVIDLAGNIDLPSHMFECLGLYVGGLYLSQMGGEEHTAKG